ncbi:MAG: metallophosphoesterase [Candidatus Bathyarchaeota archaeon]|nr:metallophosphoesterase [Candidatus Bathyarchaeota archaeon]
MIIGLIADTHDNIYMIQKAVEKFNEERVSLVLHAGDYIAPFTAQHFKPLNAQLIGVFGNNCAEHEHLKQVYGDIGVELRGYFTEVDVDGLKIALLHGHRKEDTDRAFSGGYDIIVRGHTHRASIGEENGILVVNPGEACGYVTGRRSIAFLDTERRFAWLSDLD